MVGRWGLSGRGEVRGDGLEVEDGLDGRGGGGEGDDRGGRSRLLVAGGGGGGEGRGGVKGEGESKGGGFWTSSNVLLAVSGRLRVLPLHDSTLADSTAAAG